MKTMKQFLALTFSMMVLFACTNDDDTTTINDWDVDNLELADVYGTWNVTHRYDSSIEEYRITNIPYDSYEKYWGVMTGEGAEEIICPDKPDSFINFENLKIGFTSTRSYGRGSATGIKYNYDTPLYSNGEFNCDTTGKTLGIEEVEEFVINNFVEKYVIDGNYIYYIENEEDGYKAYRLLFQDNGEVVVSYADEDFDADDIDSLVLASLTYDKNLKMQKESTEITFSVDDVASDSETTVLKQSIKSVKRFLIE